MVSLRLLVIATAALKAVEAFCGSSSRVQPTTILARPRNAFSAAPLLVPTRISVSTKLASHHGAVESSRRSLLQWRQRLFQLVRHSKRTLFFAMALLLASLTMARPSVASTASPLSPSLTSLLAKARGRDPVEDAIQQQRARNADRERLETAAMQREAEEIEAARGPSARKRLERRWEERRQRQVAEKAAGLMELKRNLLEQGMDPTADLEGRRQVVFYECGLDLGTVPGTPFFLEKQLERLSYKRSMAFTKHYNRQVIAAMVRDLRARGLDPLEYAQEHPNWAKRIMDLPSDEAQAMAYRYVDNLQRYGQIASAKISLLNALEAAAQSRVALASTAAATLIGAGGVVYKMNHDETKRLELKQQFQKIVGDTKQTRANAKEKIKDILLSSPYAPLLVTPDVRSKMEKAAAEKAKKKPTVAPIPAVHQPKNGYNMTAALLDAQQRGAEISSHSPSYENFQVASIPQEKKNKPSIVPLKENLKPLAENLRPLAATLKPNLQPLKESLKKVKLNVRASVKDGLNDLRNSAREVKENLKDNIKDAKKEDGERTLNAAKKNKAKLPIIRKLKKLNGQDSATVKQSMRELFAKRRVGREDGVVDLFDLVSPGAKAPDFALMLAKMLSFGTPELFPHVTELGGGMPIDEFHFEAATELLAEARASEDLTLEEIEQIYDRVVKSMLTEIVDLESPSLKGREDQTTLDAINTVVDFMAHSSRIYDALDQGLAIHPAKVDKAFEKAPEVATTVTNGSTTSSWDNLRADYERMAKLYNGDNQ